MVVALTPETIEAIIGLKKRDISFVFLTNNDKCKVEILKTSEDFDFSKKGGSFKQSDLDTEKFSCQIFEAAIKTYKSQSPALPIYIAFYFSFDDYNTVTRRLAFISVCFDTHPVKRRTFHGLNLDGLRQKIGPMNDLHINEPNKMSWDFVRERIIEKLGA